MTVFLDTNVILEYLLHRKHYDDVVILLKAAEQGLLVACTSTIAFATLTNLIGTYLKRNDVHEPQKRQQTRAILNALLTFLRTIDLTQEALTTALNDPTFKDIEDSYQYQCALANACDYFVTLNLKDFPVSRGKLQTLSPQDFVKTFVS